MIFNKSIKKLLILSLILLIAILLIECSPQKRQKNYKFVEVKKIILNFPKGNIVGQIFDILEYKNKYYLVDKTANAIWVTDINGQLIKKIGRKGKGPGDLSEPVSIALKGDTLFVLEQDNSRVSLFTDCGDFISSFIVKNGMLSSLEISRNSKKIIIGESLGIWDYQFYSITGKPLSHPTKEKKTDILMPTSISGGQISVTKNNNILFSGIRQYNIVMLNWKGDTLKSFSAAPDNYSAPDLYNRKKLKMQKFWSIIMLPLELDDYILIQRFNKFLPTSQKTKNTFYCDIFSVDGKLIAESITSNCLPFLYQKNGLLYSIDYKLVEKGKVNPAILISELCED